MYMAKMKKNEKIILGDDIEIVITEVFRGGTVIGIKCPKELKIKRVHIPKEVLNEATCGQGSIGNC